MAGQMRVVVVMLMVIFSAQCYATASETRKPELFQKLLDCRAIVAPTARLACFDAQIALLDEAETRRDVVIVDKAQVSKAKRSLFGFTLPNLSIFGGDQNEQKSEEAEFAEIESTVKSAYLSKTGKWIIIIEDGAKWIQTDARGLNTPKPGQPVRIRRAALGSFLANVNKQIAIRVRREN